MGIEDTVGSGLVAGAVGMGAYMVLGPFSYPYAAAKALGVAALGGAAAMGLYSAVKGSGGKGH